VEVSRKFADILLKYEGSFTGRLGGVAERELGTEKFEYISLRWLESVVEPISH
jgi:hypothetical protein